MRAWALALAVTVTVGWFLPATASADPPSRAEVRQLLSRFDDTPGVATWRALGPEALTVLIALYGDPDEAPYVRLRAVYASGFYATPATRTFLLGVARAPGQSDLFVRQALAGLARAFGPRAVDDLRPFLGSAEASVREGAALALARVDGPAAREALRRQLAIEPVPHVRGTLERSLRPRDPP